MDLNKISIKKIRELIVFTALIPIFGAFIGCWQQLQSVGIVGMLVFIPLLSVFYTIFREYVYLRLKKQRIKRVTTTEIEKYTEDKK